MGGAWNKYLLLYFYGILFFNKNIVYTFACKTKSIFNRINKCLLVLLLALGYCHVQAQKSQKDPLSEALVRLNQKVDSELIPGIKRFPLIGISTDISPKRTAVNTAYVQSVILSGGIPYMIPVTDNVEILRQIVSQLDGIVFTGGEDIQPMYYGDLPYENWKK